MGAFVVVDPNAQGIQQILANALQPNSALTPTGVSLTLNFNPIASGGSGQYIQLPILQLQQLGKLTVIQTIFIDQSQNDNAVTLNIPGSLQNITAKGRTQGFYPLIFPQGAASINFSTALGTGLVPIVLLNIAIQGVVWATQ